jgi:hypothetical protein
VANTTNDRTMVKKMDVRTMLQASLDAEGIGHLAPFAEAIWGQEGGHREDSDVVGAKTKSGEKARSPFQLMPATARGLGYKGTDEDLQRPEIAAPYMAKLLAQDFKRFNGDYGDMAAAYYSGKAVKDASGRYVGGPPQGVPGPSTHEYAQQVLGRMGQTGGQAPVAQFQSADPDALIAENFAERRKLLEGSLTPTPEYAGMFNEIMARIEGQKAPEPMPVPSRPSALMRGIAGFAGGMNAVQTGSGQLAQNIASTIAGRDRDASEAEELNYARKQAFDSSKENKLLDLKMKILEMKRDDAVKRGDRDLALKIAEQELKLSEKLKKIRDEDEAKQKETEDSRKQANELEKIEAQTQGRLKVVDRRAAVESISGDYGVPKEIAQQMHDHRTAITTAFNTQMQALGGIASLSDAKAKQLREELMKDLLESDRLQLEIYHNSAAGKAAAAKQVAPPVAAPAPAPTAADSVGYYNTPAPTDSAAQPKGRGRLGL